MYRSIVFLMRKILYVLFALVALSIQSKAEVVSRDTVAYEGEWKMEKVLKTNDYGEVSVRYVCYLYDIVNSKGEPRKVTVDKATYESDDITHIVYNMQDSGARKIAKAINIRVPRKTKAHKDKETLTTE